MASVVRFLELAYLLGRSDPEQTRFVRPLQGSGLIRKATVTGGGKNAVHLDNREAGILILSAAAAVPSEVVATVQALAALEDVAPREGDMATNLLGHLAYHIHDRALQILSDIRTLPQDNPYIWELALCLHPLSATMMWTHRTTGEVMEKKKTFREPQYRWVSQPIHPQEIFVGVRRVTFITEFVLEKAAELYADTMKRLNENTGPLPGEPVPTRTP